MVWLLRFGLGAEESDFDSWEGQETFSYLQRPGLR
jgi:hypothetical protein